MEDEKIVYTISEETNSNVDEGVETMDEWLALMSDEELAVYHTICNKNPEDRTNKDNYEISKYALILYCRELGLTKLSITNKLITNISGFFVINIIIESLRRKGYATTEGPLLLYKETKTTITDKGRKYLSNYNIDNE